MILTLGDGGISLGYFYTLLAIAGVTLASLGLLGFLCWRLWQARS